MRNISAASHLTIKLYLSLLATTTLYLLSPLFRPVLGAIGYNDQRAFASALVGLGAAIVAISGFSKRGIAPLPRRLEHVVWLTVLFGVIAAAGSAFVERALLDVCLFVCVFYLASWTYQYYQTIACERVFSSLSYVAVGFIAAYAVVFVFSYTIWLLLPDFYCYSCVMPHFDNMRTFNGVQVWLLPFLWYFALQSRASYWRRCFSLIPAVFFAALLFYTYARGATLAVVAAIVFIWFRYRQNAKQFAIVAGGSVALGWLLNFFLTRVVPDFVGRPLPIDMLSRLGSGSSGRTALWQAALEMLAKSPAFGVGPQHYSYELFHHYQNLKPFGSAHNLYLNILVEWGLIGGLIILFGLFYFFFAVARKHSNNSDARLSTQEQQIGVATLVSVYVSALFGGGLISPMSQLMLVLFAPALLLVARPKPEPSSDASSDGALNGRYGYSILLLGAACYLIGMTVYDILAHGDVIFITTETAYPRYWQNGLFWRY